MRKTIIIAAAAALLSPSALLADTNAASESDRVDVAYKALAEGRTQDALAQLRDSEAVRAGDPAALINLGSAYARQGRVSDARAAFTAAMNSKTRYDLELGNGAWIDSREAAKRALEGLAARTDLAMR
jgi:cytochrome c-type biogenesis protein CcmH/NrfG